MLNFLLLFGCAILGALFMGLVGQVFFDWPSRYQEWDGMADKPIVPEDKN